MAYHNPEIKGSSFETKAEAVKKEVAQPAAQPADSVKVAQPADSVKVAQPAKPAAQPAAQPVTKDK